MEQRRFSGKSQWYHETQSSQNQNHVQPLVPEAAQVDDRFLLDLKVAAPSQATDGAWLTVGRQLASILLPDQVETNQLHTLSHYERLSTALTVAQVFGVQRLCNHYAARLAPESSSDSSRETNRRLTQITQFSRQLASQPTSISDISLVQLDECGLSVEDIVTFNQLIGFIGFQAQTLAILQALARQPVRQIPGLTGQQDAEVDLFRQQAVRWLPNLTPLERRFANTEQVQALEPGKSSPLLNDLVNILAFDTSTLQALEQLTHLLQPATELRSDDDLVVFMLVSRINGSPSCFSDAATAWQGKQGLPDAMRNGEPALVAWSHNHPRERAIIQAVSVLTRTPDRFSYAELARLLEQGFTEPQAIRLLLSSGLTGWLNRLKIGLGRTSDELKTLPV
ncbi:CMD domain-containing protein [uncultured Cedecea sp.]|uniref:CMD domain-containing protein n=1 Tax=uncultured Cedecea sp. TaxID=988762 RepID=UPI00262EE1A7|nr:CMD domain-containing protein [uncultured Cedecea sp.]